MATITYSYKKIKKEKAIMFIRHFFKINKDIPDQNIFFLHQHTKVESLADAIDTNNIMLAKLVLTDFLNQDTLSLEQSTLVENLLIIHSNKEGS